MNNPWRRETKVTPHPNSKLESLMTQLAEPLGGHSVILLLNLDHPHGPARVPQMCSSQETCGSRNHHQMQIPGFQSCTTQESNRVAVFYIQRHLTIATHIQV